MSREHLDGTVIENRFVLQARIGQGSFGEIYEGNGWVLCS